MKINQKLLMTIFLMLLIGSSLQLKNFEDQHDEYQEKTDQGNDPQPTADQNNVKSPSPNEEVVRATLYDANTNWADDKNRKLNALEDHNVNCAENNSALNSFRYENTTIAGGLLKKEKTEIRFNYTCVKSPYISDRCFSQHTAMETLGFRIKKSLTSLVKHYVDCPIGSVMKGFTVKTEGKFYGGAAALLRLGPEGRPKVQYFYTCCEADISRTIYSETQQTSNPDNSMHSLSDQQLQGRDFNAISSFHMQAPTNFIYYQIRVGVLKGETSPYFPLTPTPNDIKTGSSNAQSFVGKNYLINII